MTYIRIFEPAWARALGVDVQGFDDLDAHPSLILKSGHIERDGEVVITSRASASEPMPETSLRVDCAERDGAASVALLSDGN